MIGYSEKNKKNCPRKCFDERKKRPGLKFKPEFSANGPSNNWAQKLKITLPLHTLELTKTKIVLHEVEVTN